MTKTAKLEIKSNYDNKSNEQDIQTYKVQRYTRCRDIQGAETYKVQRYTRCRDIQGAEIYKVYRYTVYRYTRHTGT